MLTATLGLVVGEVGARTGPARDVALVGVTRLGVEFVHTAFPE